MASIISSIGTHYPSKLGIIFEADIIKMDYVIPNDSDAWKNNHYLDVFTLRSIKICEDNVMLFGAIFNHVIN